MAFRMLHVDCSPVTVSWRHVELCLQGRYMASPWACGQCWAPLPVKCPGFFPTLGQGWPLSVPLISLVIPAQTDPHHCFLLGFHIWEAGLWLCSSLLPLHSLPLTSSSPLSLQLAVQFSLSLSLNFSLPVLCSCFPALHSGLFILINLLIL